MHATTQTDIAFSRNRQTVTDGVIAGNRAQETFNLSEASCIQPDALADLYLDVICQDKSCWSQEIDARPYLEKF